MGVPLDSPPGGWGYAKKAQGAAAADLDAEDAARESPRPSAVEVERDRLAAAIKQQAVLRFDQFGPHDARAAAFWDVAAGIRERTL